jgi:hypothetical protein
MSIDALQVEIEALLRKHGLWLARPVEVDMQSPREEVSMFGAHPVARTVGKFRLSFTAETEQLGDWRYQRTGMRVTNGEAA